MALFIYHTFMSKGLSFFSHCFFTNSPIRNVWPFVGSSSGTIYYYSSLSVSQSVRHQHLDNEQRNRIGKKWTINKAVVDDVSPFSFAMSVFYQVKRKKIHYSPLFLFFVKIKRQPSNSLDYPVVRFFYPSVLFPTQDCITMKMFSLKYFKCTFLLHCFPNN